MTRAPEPPPLYVWDVEAHGQARRVSECGVTDDRHLACVHVHQILQESPPGTHGTVRRVALDPVHTGLYVDCGDVGEACHDADTGGIVWSQAPPRNGSWLDLRFARARAELEAIPPEQHGRWWAAFRARDEGGQP